MNCQICHRPFSEHPEQQTGVPVYLDGDTGQDEVKELAQSLLKQSAEYLIVVPDDNDPEKAIYLFHASTEGSFETLRRAAEELVDCPVPSLRKQL